ncbi:lysozyme-like protein [Lactarius hengduanensis]|nr:lysozyme-like protein [Lactarius hengduanensis]
MKLSVGLATFTILLATAIVEATWLDAATHKRQPAHVDNARDVAPRAGLIKASSGQCGPPGATKKVTKVSGPNGNIDWINCGITGGGWTPPRVEIKQLVTVTLASARHTAFAPCRDNIMATFEKYGKIHGIPSILLASIAMQESSCIPSAVGGAGEQGLMQLTHEKCKGAPGGNCQDIDFNIRIGAEFFATLLAANKGDIFTTIGKYNGWYHWHDICAYYYTFAANTCCRCQNNLDYVHQFVNGWLQGINAYDAGLGKYFNLDRCQ